MAEGLERLDLGPGQWPTERLWAQCWAGNAVHWRLKGRAFGVGGSGVRPACPCLLVKGLLMGSGPGLDEGLCDCPLSPRALHHQSQWPLKKCEIEAWAVQLSSKVWGQLLPTSAPRGCGLLALYLCHPPTHVTVFMSFFIACLSLDRFTVYQWLGEA